MESKTIRIVQGLFVAACIAWMFGVLGRFELGNGVSLHLLDVVVGMLTVLIALDAYRAKAFPDSVAKGMLVWVGVACVSLVGSLLVYSPIQVLNGSLYLLRWIAYAPLLWMLAGRPEMRRTVQVGLTSAMFGTLVLGYGQYFLYPDLRNLFYAGWDEHLYRMFGTQLDPNYLGAMLCVSGVWFGMMLRAAAKAKIASNVYRKILYSLLGCAIVLSLIGVLLTYSRGAYLMAGVMAVSLILSYRAKRAFVLVVLGLILLSPLMLSQRASEGVQLLRTASIHARLIEYQEALTIYEQRPILGHGYNMYRYVAFAEGFVDKRTWQSDHAGAGVPNSYLFILVTTGLAGLGAYLYGMKKVYGLVTHDVLMRSLLLGIAAHALVENSFVYPYLMFPVYVMISYINNNRKT